MYIYIYIVQVYIHDKIFHKYQFCFSNESAL